MSKTRTVNHFFDKQLYIINLLLKSGLTIVIFFVDDKNLQKFSLKGEVMFV